jgi:hypothetical protein
MLEGALFEGRVGNVKGAREVMKFLMSRCTCQGPVFYEASKFEE